MFLLCKLCVNRVLPCSFGEDHFLLLSKQLLTILQLLVQIFDNLLIIRNFDFLSRGFTLICITTLWSVGSLEFLLIQHNIQLLILRAYLLNFLLALALNFFDLVL